MGRLRIGIAQQNCTVGDLEGNFEKIAEVMEQAEKEGVQLLCFPELALTGYPPEDLALNMDFVAHNLEYIEQLGRRSGEMVSLVGFIDRDEDCFNAAAVLHRGKVAGVYHKSFLPNYGVFDENRYFSPGQGNLVLLLNGVRVGVTVCEDIWSPGGPLEEEIAYGGAEVIVNASASPFNRGKQEGRERMVQSRAQDGQVILVYANAVGGQDELVFDGRSFVYHPDQGLVLRGPAFEEALLVTEVDTDLPEVPAVPAAHPPLYAARSAHPPHRAVEDIRQGRGRREAFIPTRPGGLPVPPERKKRTRAGRSTRHLSWALRTTFARTASPTRCWGYPAASTPPWWRRWRWRPWATRRSIPSSCPRNTPHASPSSARRNWPPTSASTCVSTISTNWCAPTRRTPPSWPRAGCHRRTCRHASAATC